MNLHDQFANEAEFRTSFIRPLLIRMGFVGIAEMHGSQEFGKDYVFSERDRFGNYRHMAVQAKHEKSINQGATVDKVISQINEAFAIEYEPLAPLTEKRHVSAVYVFNDGEITDNARTNIRKRVKEEYRPNTYVLSGHELEILAAVLFEQQDRDMKTRLLGLKRQMGINMSTWRILRDQLSSNKEDQSFYGAGAIMQGLDECLTYPLPYPQISITLIFRLWQDARIIDRNLQRLQFWGFSGNPEWLEIQKRIIVMYCDGAIKTATTLHSQIEELIEQLPLVEIPAKG